MLTHPSSGARIRFDRSEMAEGTAEYAVRVWLPEALIRLRVVLDPSVRKARFEETGREPAGAHEPPPWLDRYLQTMARHLRRSGGAGQWPRKLVQWHGPTD